jgi:hypothetical protein
MAFLRWGEDYISRRKRQCVFKRGAVYYISASGNDSNNGTSPATPWQTYAKVRQHLIDNPSGNASYLFRRGDIFRSHLGIQLTQPRVHFGAYGPIPSSGSVRPIINHFVVRWLAGTAKWTLAAGNRWTTTVSIANQNPSSATTIGFLRLADDPLNPLMCQNTQANCEADDFSFFVSGGTVHLNLGGIDPNLLDIEAVPVQASAPCGIDILNIPTGLPVVWVENLRFDGWGCGAKGLGFSGSANESGVRVGTGGTADQAEHVAYIAGCESYYNGAHAFGQEGAGIGATLIVEDCLAGYDYDAPNGDTVFNTYAGLAQQECVYRRCAVRFGAAPQKVNTAGGRGPDKGSVSNSKAFYGHASDQVTLPINLYLNIDCTILDERSSFERATVCGPNWYWPETTPEGSLFLNTDNTNPSSIRAFVIGWRSPRYRTPATSLTPYAGCDRMIFINPHWYVRKSWTGGSPNLVFDRFNFLQLNPIIEVEAEGGNTLCMFGVGSAFPAVARLINGMILLRGHTNPSDAEARLHLTNRNTRDKMRLANTILISDRWKDGAVANESGMEIWLTRDTFNTASLNNTDTCRNIAVAGCALANSSQWYGFNGASGLLQLATPNNAYPEVGYSGILAAGLATQFGAGGSFTLDPDSPLEAAGLAVPFADKADMCPAPEYDFFGRRRPTVPAIGPFDVLNISTGGGGGGGSSGTQGIVYSPVRGASLGG